jgi:tripartite-type tricarboxylate transporter receptor subunit TctC
MLLCSARAVHLHPQRAVAARRFSSTIGDEMPATPTIPLKRCLLAAMLGAAATAQAAFPDAPITLVVGYSAGGQTDIVARKVATRMSAELGQPVVVLNRDGATSTIAYRSVATAKPDGYTMMFGGTGAHAIAPVLNKVSYDAVADFRAIGKVSTLPLSVSVNNDVPAKTLAELVALMRKDPAKYSYATAGNGGIEHLTGELFKQIAGVPDVLHVPFKGGAPAATAVIGGQVPILINPLSTVAPYVDAGRMRTLAVTGPSRMASKPDLPTAIEAGMPGLVAEGFNVLLVPSKTPDDVVNTLNKALQKVMADPAFVADLRAMNVNPLPASTPSETDSYLRSEVKRWADVIQKAKIKVD